MLILEQLNQGATTVSSCTSFLNSRYLENILEGNMKLCDLFCSQITFSKT